MGILFDDANPDYFAGGGARFVSTPPLTLYAIHKTDDQNLVVQYLLAVGSTTQWWGLVRGKHITTQGIGARTKPIIASKTAWSAGLAVGWVASCAVFVSDSDRRIFSYNIGLGASSGTNTVAAAITLTSGSNYIGCNSVNLQTFSGIISVVGFWNVALSDAEATGLVRGFYNPRFLQPANLVGYASMKEMNVGGDIRNFINNTTFVGVGSPSLTSGGPEIVPDDLNHYYKKVPKGLPDSAGRMNRQKLTEGVF